MKRPILSASNFGDAILCPGKVKLEAPFADQPSTYAARGTNLHPYFCTDRPREGLSPADIDLLNRADVLADKFITEFLTIVGLDPEAVSPTSEEHEAAMDGMVPGHADYMPTWIDGEREIVAILDLKSGMGDVEEAPSNWQLACYAALRWERRPFSLCGVAIVQPDAFGPRLTTALYRADQMRGVIEAIRKGKQATEAPDAPRVPDAERQCRFCRAKAVCPEYRDGFQIVETAQLAVASLPNLELGTLKKIINRAKSLDEEVTDEIRRRLELGEFPGWKFRNTGSVRTLTAPLGALRAIQTYLDDRGFAPMTAKAFDGTRKLVWGELEELFARLTGFSDKRAKEALKEILSEYTVETAKKPAVVEIK